MISRYSKFGAENQSVFELCYRKWINNRKYSETGVSNNKKTSIKQAEVARSPENYEERYASSIIL